MALSNTTTLNDLVGQFVSPAAISAAYSTRVGRAIVTGRVVPPGNTSIVIPKFTHLAVASLTEGVAPSSTTLSTDGVTLTPLERGVFVEVSKRALYGDPWQDLAPYGDQIGRALAEDEDTRIFAAMESGFAGQVVNQGTGALTLASFQAAISTLEAAGAPHPYFAVFHPYSWAKMRALLGDASAFANVGRGIVEGFAPGYTNMQGYVGSPYGIPCFISNTVDTFDATPSRRPNFVFSQSAFACAWLNDIRIDVDDNVVARKIDMMGWYSIDCAVVKAEWGVVLQDTLT